VPLSEENAPVANTAATPEQALCQTCSGGILAQEAVNTALWEGDRLIVVENIPALVCQQCGERYYEDEVAMALDMMRGGGFSETSATRVMSVPVFSFRTPSRTLGEHTSGTDPGASDASE